MTINEAMFFTWVMVFFACAVIWEILKYILKALVFYTIHKLEEGEKLPQRINPDDYKISESGEIVHKTAGVESNDFLQQAKQNHDDLFGQEIPPKYSIEPHGADGGFVLYHGRDMNHHGANLCTLSRFDARGEETRKLIVDALNSEKTP